MPPQKKKKGFGEKLKGVGRRIVQEAKKAPGTIYREGIKPEAKRILEKFTEEGPAPTGPRIKDEPQAGTFKGPFEGTPTGFRLGRLTSHLPAEIRPPKEKVSRPAPKAKTIAEQVKPASYPLAGGRTTAYDPAFRGSKSAVERLNESYEAERKAKGGAAPKTTTPKTAPTKGTTRKESTTKPSDVTFKVEVKGPKAPDKIDVYQGRRKQRAKTRTAKAAKPGKRRFSATKTYKEIGKAAAASQKPIERIDTTGQDLARILTEQEIAREAQRTETELKGGRKPQREKARYRFRTRGLKRSEGRGR